MILAQAESTVRAASKAAAKKKKKPKKKRKSLQRYGAKRIKPQLMENIIKCSYPKMTDQTRV